MLRENQMPARESRQQGNRLIGLGELRGEMVQVLSLRVLLECTSDQPYAVLSRRRTLQCQRSLRLGESLQRRTGALEVRIALRCVP